MIMLALLRQQHILFGTELTLTGWERILERQRLLVNHSKCACQLFDDFSWLML